MGNKDSKPTTSLSDWQKIDTDNGVQIYKNKKNNQLAEKRAITIDPHYDLNDQLKIYHMRQHNRDALVRAFGTQNIQKKSHSQGMCSGHKKVYVLTEKMPYRLSQLPQLTFPQSLVFLRQALRAYSKIYKVNGPVHVTKNLIGINEFGEVKSWVNQNWALNHPDTDFPKLQTTRLQDLKRQQFLAYGVKYRDQAEMVHNIVAVVQQKCMEGKFPAEFRQQVQNNSGSFKKLQLYLQDFVSINKLFIPPKINYQTVCVSKYQTRYAQQLQLSGQNYNNNRTVVRQNTTNNQQQNINQIQTVNNRTQVENQSQQQGVIHRQQINNQQFSGSNTRNYGYNNTAQYNNNTLQYQQPASNISQNIGSGYSTGYNNGYGYNQQSQGIRQNNPIAQNQSVVVNRQFIPSQSSATRNLQANSNLNGGYTVTKTVTTTINDNTAGQERRIVQQNNYNPSSSLYSVNNNYNWSSSQANTRYIQNVPTLPKPTVVESKYTTSSYYQPANLKTQSNSINLGANYNFGGILGGTQTVSKYQTYKPYSGNLQSYNNGKSYQYTTLVNKDDKSLNLGDSKTRLAGYSQEKKTGQNNLFQIGNISYQYNDGKKINQNQTAYLSNNISPANNYHYSSSVQQYSTNNQPISTTANYTTVYKSTVNKVIEPQINVSSNSAEKESTYSFDGRQDFNQFANQFSSSKYPNAYSGSGYSNTLTKYQTSANNLANQNVHSKFQTVTHLVNEKSSALQGQKNSFNIEGKYADAFKNLLGPALGNNLQSGTNNLSRSVSSEIPA